MKPSIRRLVPLSLLVAFTGGCDSDEPGAPAVLEPATITVSLTFPEALESSAGIREGYLKTNRLYVQFRDQTSAREERRVEFQPSDQESHYPMSVRLRSPRESMSFMLEVQFGNATVFRAETPVILRAGRLTEVQATLIPVLAGVRAPDTVPVITAWGDTVRLGAAGILATGDTIEGVLIDWRSLDAGVASIADDGTVVGLADGTARMVALSDAFSDTALVRVQAAVANVAITPPRASIPLRTTKQYTVSLFDRRGNLLPSQPVTWSSSDPSIITIDQSGLATAVGIGTVMIDLTVGTVNVSTEATGSPIAPEADSLHALVTGTTSATLSALIIPNGALTRAFFEWGPVGTQTPELSPPKLVGVGLLPEPVSEPLTNLKPSTLHYAVAHASNSAGAAISDTLWFTTGSPPFSKLPPVIVTEGWTLIQQPLWAAFIGSAETGAIATDTWFEWGTDPNLQGATKTQVRNINGTGKLTVTEPVLVPAPGTYYFRFVGQNGNGTSHGAILSLTLMTPPDVTTGPSTTKFEGNIRLKGTANPNGSATTAWIEWSESSSDPSTFKASPVKLLGAGTSPVSFLHEVPNGTTGYYRAVAKNGGGTVYGAVIQF